MREFPFSSADGTLQLGVYTLHSTLYRKAYVSRGSQIKLLYGFDPSRDAEGTLQLGVYRGAYVSRGHQIKLLYGFDPSRDVEMVWLVPSRDVEMVWL